jgi:hypothetical protein
MNIWLIIILLFGIASTSRTVILTISLLSGFIIILGLIKKISSKTAIVSTLAVLIIGLGIVQLAEGRNLRNIISAPPTPPFHTDMITYLNTLYKIRSGENFYEAFSESVKSEMNSLPAEIWAWKQPLIFYLFKFFPGGSMSVIYLAIFNFSLVLLSSYFIGRKFLTPVSALICPFLIWPYFTYPLIEQTIMQVEWWGLSFLIFGLLCYFYDKKLLCGIMLALSLSSRELFIIPIAFLIFVDLFNKKFTPTIKLILPIIFIFLPLYIAHLYQISNYQNPYLLTLSSFRKNSLSGWEMVRPALAYNSWSYALTNIRPFLILIILNTTLLVIKIIREKKVFDLILISSFLPFFIISFKLGSDPWHDYWGIYYIPLVLLVTPISVMYIPKLRFLLPKEQKTTI